MMDWKRFGIVGLGLLASCVANAADRYEIIDLSSTSINLGEVLALSNSGKISFGGFNTAHIWENGVYTPVSGPPQTTFRPMAINFSGALGGYISGGGDSTPGMWPTPNSFLDFAMPSGQAFGMNDSGTVVGHRRVGQYTVGFIRTANGTITNLPTLGGHDGSARVINNAGLVAGYVSDANSNMRAALFNGVTLTDLGCSPGFTNGYPRSINSLGDVAGDQATTATVWYFGQQPALLGSVGSDSENHALSINDSRQIVGYTYGNSGYRAVLWENGNTILFSSLAPSSGWQFKVAKAINNQGWIIGDGFFGGIDRPFLAIPTVGVVPTSVVCNKGTVKSGGVSDLLASDNLRLKGTAIGRDRTFQLDITGTTSATTARRLDIDFETSCTGAGSTLRVYAYNFSTSSWSLLDISSPVASDTLRSVFVGADAPQYLSGGQVKFRVEFKNLDPTMKSVLAGVDWIHWTISP